jgi:hypothetical protein
MEGNAMTSSAEILPFPIARRQAFIRKQADHASLMNPDAGIRYVIHALDVQADTMRRRGIDEDLVQRELRCMASAIRAAFAQRTARPGGKP